MCRSEKLQRSDLFTCATFAANALRRYVAMLTAACLVGGKRRSRTTKLIIGQSSLAASSRRCGVMLDPSLEERSVVALPFFLFSIKVNLGS